LVPAALIALLGAIGICSSYHLAANFFRAQLAVFLLVLAAVLAGAGCFTVASTNAMADWLLDGCDGHRTRGTWSAAGRISEKMRSAYGDYASLKSGLEACRALNPLVFDLADCGMRARLAHGGLASEVKLYGWFQSAQTTLACGGFCSEEVPLFGLTHLADTLVTKAACAEKVSAFVESLGYVMFIIAVVIAVLVLGVSLVLFRSTMPSDDEYDEVDMSDPDDEYAMYSDADKSGRMNAWG